MGSDHNFVFGPDAELQIKDENELREPKMFRVILHNDHYTTMEFVVEILVNIFHKPAREAKRIMLDVHRCGSGDCGVYSLDIARTKVSQVYALARQHDFPLRCSAEEA
jgi:ATP-dependent Clp protease adaptor protein ClpS